MELTRAFTIVVCESPATLHWLVAPPAYKGWQIGLYCNIPTIVLSTGLPWSATRVVAPSYLWPLIFSTWAVRDGLLHACITAISNTIFWDGSQLHTSLNSLLPRWKFYPAKFQRSECSAITRATCHAIAERRFATIHARVLLIFHFVSL